MSTKLIWPNMFLQMTYINKRLCSRDRKESRYLDAFYKKEGQPKVITVPIVLGTNWKIVLYGPINVTQGANLVKETPTRPLTLRVLKCLFLDQSLNSHSLTLSLLTQINIRRQLLSNNNHQKKYYLNGVSGEHPTMPEVYCEVRDPVIELKLEFSLYGS